MMNTSPNNEDIKTLYRDRAKRYDLTIKFYYLFWIRILAYRKQAIRAMNLKRGDVVVEIGCGTGLNFEMIQKAIGPEGKIIGVDLTDAMLAQARQRVEKMGSTNVELVLSDASAYKYPPNLDGIISTFGMNLMPEYDKIIKNGSEALSSGKRFVILDTKVPSKLPKWLFHVAVSIARPFGTTMELAGLRDPWKSMEKYLVNFSCKEIYLGFLYLSVGEAS